MMQVGMQLAIVYCFLAVITAATHRLTVRCDCRPWQQEQQMGGRKQVAAGWKPQGVSFWSLWWTGLTPSSYSLLP